MAPMTGKPYWTRRVRQSRWSWGSSTSSKGSLDNESTGRRNLSPSSWARTAERIEEAEVGPLEARLLGLPDEVVYGFKSY